MKECFKKLFKRNYIKVKDVCPACGTSHNEKVTRKINCYSYKCKEIIIINPDDVLGEGNLKNIYYDEYIGGNGHLRIYCSYECYKVGNPSLPDWGN